MSIEDKQDDFKGMVDALSPLSIISRASSNSMDARRDTLDDKDYKILKLNVIEEETPHNEHNKE